LRLRTYPLLEVALADGAAAAAAACDDGAALVDGDLGAATTAASSNGGTGNSADAPSAAPRRPEYGGRLTFKLSHEWAPAPCPFPGALHVVVGGAALHAPLIERLVELPMDVHAGTLDGELHIVAGDEASWEFPHVFGKVDVRGADFHFWDAPDELAAVDMDLLFERDRCYLHAARGYYGAAPLTCSGASWCCICVCFVARARGRASAPRRRIDCVRSCDRRRWHHSSTHQHKRPEPTL
jgi:hypothetical protein